MVFNSLEFVIFLFVALLCYPLFLPSEKRRDAYLLCISYVFYMSWYWIYASIIMLSTLVDYSIGRCLEKENDEKRRKLLLVISLVVNLGILAVFKYFNFFAEYSSHLFNLFGIEINAWVSDLLLPVGISFYTFQTLSYTIDLYRRKIPCEHNFLKFAAYVSFFPQLVAGPIVRAADFLPQLNRKVITISSEDVQKGFFLIMLGLFKKVIIADALAIMAVDAVFDNPQAYSSAELMLGLYAYSMQIYCDFSGYSDIAIGVALLFGFVLPVNFNRPYVSATPSEFWSRWHITLSTWLRDYLYISLGGNRGGELLTLRNLMITMVLGGLWHGAAMNFVLWGVFHGSILVMYRILGITDGGGFRFLKQLVFFHLTLVGWLLFRVTDMKNFSQYVAGLSNLTSGVSFSGLFFLTLLVGFFLHFSPIVLKEKFYLVFSWMPRWVQSGALAGFMMLLLGYSVSESAFIYFQF